MQDSEKSEENGRRKEKGERDQSIEKGELGSEPIEEKGGNEEKEKQIVCSVCREIHPLPEMGIDGFVRDLRVELQSQAVIHYASRLGNGTTCESWVSPHASESGTPSNEAHGIRNRKEAVSFYCSCRKFYCQLCTDYHQELMRQKEGEHYQEHTLIHKSEEGAKNGSLKRSNQMIALVRSTKPTKHMS